MKSILVAIIALASTAPFVGCSSDGGGSTAEDACQKQCDCNSQCDKSDLAECVQKGKTAEAQAEKAGCGTEFADTSACASDKCFSSAAELEEACGDELEALEKCEGQSNGGG